MLLKPVPMPIRLLAHIMGRDGVEPKATGLQPVPIPLTVYLPKIVNLVKTSSPREGIDLKTAPGQIRTDNLRICS